MHHGLGYLVGDGLAHDVEVGRDQPADEVGFEGFAFGEGRVGVGVEVVGVVGCFGVGLCVVLVCIMYLCRGKRLNMGKKRDQR